MYNALYETSESNRQLKKIKQSHLKASSSIDDWSVKAVPEQVQIPEKVAEAESELSLEEEQESSQSPCKGHAGVDFDAVKAIIEKFRAKWEKVDEKKTRDFFEKQSDIILTKKVDKEIIPRIKKQD